MHARAPRLAALTVLLVVVAGLSCGGDATAPRVPTSIALATLSVSLDAIGASQSIAATVTDQNEVVIPNAAITWSSSAPGVATVSSSGTTTAVANGTAVITAHIAAINATATVVVRQVAVAPQKVGGDQQSATPGSALPQPVKVKVADRLGGAMAGQAVSFAVTQGGGSIGTPSVASGSDGIASTVWTIGTNAADGNQLTVTVTGASGVTTFTATTLTGPAVGITFGTGLPTVDVGATAPVSASARDGFGNPIQSGAATLISRNPAILTVSPSGTMTGVARGQTIIVATTTGSAAFTDSTVAVVRAPGAPVLVSSLKSFTLAHDTTITVSVFVNFATSATRVASGLITVAWDPSVLHFTASAAGSSGGAIINSAGAGAGSLALAFADANGFTGSVEIARITFQAGSAVGASGNFTLTASDMSGGDFADLTTNLVQVVQRVVIR